MCGAAVNSEVKQSIGRSAVVSGDQRIVDQGDWIERAYANIKEKLRRCA